MSKKSSGAGGTSPASKGGKAAARSVTSDTVRRLEKAGSSESAKIARTFVKKK